MKKLLLLTSILFSTAFVAQAGHSVGAEINYQYIGNNQYRVIIKFYRDCRGTAMGSINIGYRAGSGGNSTSCGSGALTGFVRTQINEVTYVCSTGKKPCYPQNTGGTGEGIEEHIFEDTLDMSKAPFASIISNNSCTELIIYAGQCCRSGAITTGPGGDDFWVTTTLFLDNIKKCAKQTNDNPVFNRYWPIFMCCSQPMYSSLGARDTIDYDSLSFDLVPALSSLAVNPVTYTSPFSSKYPLTCYCPGGKVINCTPNIQTSPPSGFYMNPRTGDIITTPMKCDEVAIIVVEATEWRRDTSGKMVQISKTIRDNQLITKDDCGYNNSPVIAGNFAYKVGLGGKICATFNIEDKQFTPYQTKRDSVVLDWQGSADNATWKVTRDTNVGKATLEFCWQVPKTAKSGIDYHFSIGASDQHCPKPAFSSRTFIVRVLERDTANVAISTGQNCSGVLAEATLNKGKITDATFNWNLYDSATGKFIANALSATANFKYLKKGSYKLTLDIDHGKYIYSSFTGYFRVTTEIPTVNLGVDRNVCLGSGTSLVPTLKLMKSPVVYEWFANNVEDTFQKASTYVISNVDQNYTIRLIAMDSNGCIARDTVAITALGKPLVKWEQNPLNARCWADGDFLLNDRVKSPDKTDLKPGNFRIYGTITQYGNLGLADSTAGSNYYFRQSNIDNNTTLSNGKSLVEKLILWYKDTFGCENRDTTSIRIYGNPVIELIDKSFCQDLGSGLLDSLVIRPKVKFGTFQEWRAVQSPAGVATSGLVKDISGGSGTSWKFFFGNTTEDFYAGEYKLEFKVTDQVTGCFTRDTSTITVLAEPVLTAFPISTICAGQNKYDLLGLFGANGNAPDPAFSTFKINSRNGDTAKKSFGGAFIAGHDLKGPAAGGNWSIQCTYSNKGCMTTIPSMLTLDYTPVAAFTTTPSSQAPVSSPQFSINNTSSIESGEALNYQWYFEYPNFSKSSTGFAPQINFAAVDSTYTIWLEARTNKFCADTVTQKAIIGKGVASISGIVMDNIRIDSRFVISGITFQKAEMNVFNEVGQRIAQTSQNEGIDLPAGVYLYQVKIKINNTDSFIYSGKIAVGQK